MVYITLFLKCTFTVPTKVQEQDGLASVVVKTGEQKVRKSQDCCHLPTCRKHCSDLYIFHIFMLKMSITVGSFCTSVRPAVEQAKVAPTGVERSFVLFGNPKTAQHFIFHTMVACCLFFGSGYCTTVS